MKRQRLTADPEALAAACDVVPSLRWVHVQELWPDADQHRDDYLQTAPADVIIRVLLLEIEARDRNISGKAAEIHELRTRINRLVGGARAVVEAFESAPATLFDLTGTGT